MHSYPGDGQCPRESCLHGGHPYKPGKTNWPNFLHGFRISDGQSNWDNIVSLSLGLDMANFGFAIDRGDGSAWKLTPTNLGASEIRAPSRWGKWGAELDAIVESISQVEARFNNRATHHYDWIFHDDVESTDNFKAVVSNATTSQCSLEVIPPVQGTVGQGDQQAGHQGWPSTGAFQPGLTNPALIPSAQSSRRTIT